MTRETSNTPSLESLMKRALAGDAIAYNLALRRTAALLKPFLLRRLSRKCDTDDVLQDILLSIHKARHTYDGERPYRPWLFAIARFRLQDYLRRYYADPLHHADEIQETDDFSELNVTESSFTYESIRSEVERLSGKQPVILERLHGQGYTSKEVAEELNMKESAVKVAAHRAYKILRMKLTRHD